MSRIVNCWGLHWCEEDQCWYLTCDGYSPKEWGGGGEIPPDNGRFQYLDEGLAWIRRNDPDYRCVDASHIIDLESYNEAWT